LKYIYLTTCMEYKSPVVIFCNGLCDRRETQNNAKKAIIMGDLFNVRSLA
jgi:hypothetical protein